MGKIDISKIYTTVKTVAVRHSPGILTGTGIAGMVITVILAVKATPEALRRIEAYKKKAKRKRLTAMETVKASWKCYIPAVVTGGASCGCLIGGNHVAGQRTAALAAAYSLSETALKEYKEKVVETIGEKKEQTDREQVAKDHIRENPVSGNTIILTGRGDTLCYDDISKRYFKSDIDKIKRAENEINRRLRNEMYISLNEFYDEIGLERIKIGDNIGWNIDKGYLELSFSTQLADDEATPCLVVDYDVVPDYNYH